MKDLILRKAKSNDRDTVATLYRSSIGREGCAWNRHYPAMEDLDGDLAAQNLYVLEQSGSVIGAVSVVHEEELETLAPWKYTGESVKGIARVVIKKECAGQGLAKKMLTMLFAKLKEEGGTAVRLSVACQNQAAMKTYQRLGFAMLAKAHLYGGEYYLAEVEL